MAFRVHLLSLSHSPGCSVLSHCFFSLEVSVTVFELTASFHHWVYRWVCHGLPSFLLWCFVVFCFCFLCPAFAFGSFLEFLSLCLHYPRVLAWCPAFPSEPLSTRITVIVNSQSDHSNICAEFEFVLMLSLSLPSVSCFFVLLCFSFSLPCWILLHIRQDELGQWVKGRWYWVLQSSLLLGFSPRNLWFSERPSVSSVLGTAVCSLMSKSYSDRSKKNCWFSAYSSFLLLCGWARWLLNSLHVGPEAQRGP